MQTEEVARLRAGPLYGKNPWPLRFHTHDFFATCFNTQACSILYNNYEFGTRRADSFGNIIDRPSGPPPRPNWRKQPPGSNAIPVKDGRTFPGPVEIEWVTADGEALAASIDLDLLFQDRLVLHTVSLDEVKKPWLDAKSVHPVVPDVILDVDDRTISVYMKAMVATEAEQIPGNPNTHFRADPMLAFAKTY